jgi:hypothetical protein
MHRKGSEIIVKKDGKEVLYSVSDGKSPIIQLAENKSHLSYFDWHKALGNPAPGSLKNPTKIYGINFPKLRKDFHCAKSNPTKSIPKSVEKQSSNLFELIHTDLSGKFSTPSIRKKNYYITCIDDYTGYAWVYFIREKS